FVRRLIVLSALLSAVPLAATAPVAHADVTPTFIFTPPACGAATPPSPDMCTFAVSTPTIKLVVSSHNLNPATASIWCGTNFATFVGGQAVNAHATASKVIAVSGASCELQVSSSNPSTGVASAGVTPLA